MSTFDENPYSMDFAQFAGKLEHHLRKNGITCEVADRIIEESSRIYFENIGPSANRLAKMLKKQNPSNVFVDSARRAIERHIPEAKDTFGSQTAISRAIH